MPSGKSGQSGEKIFLIGYRCTGKTTVGKLLAEKLGFEFCDTDQLVESSIKCTIRELVQDKGWDAFRAVEKQILFQTRDKHRIVVSTGGGIILDPENRTFIRETGISIWLDADIETIIARLCKDENTKESRPALTEESIRKETENMLALRAPMYAAASDFRLDTAVLSPAQITNQIINRS